MKKKTCCIFNLATHYNAPIYKMMDKEIKCDFYLGDRSFESIKLMNYSDLKGFKKVLPFKRIYGNFYLQKGAINLAFKNYQNYIVTGEPYCLSTWMVLIFTKLLKKRSFVWTHGWYGDETFIKKLIKKLFFKMSYKVLLYGDYARDLMIKEGFNSDRLVCIYNSLDYQLQLEVRKSLSYTSIYVNHFKNEDPVVLYIGRIQKVKKINLLIEALRLLHIKVMKCNLIIIGKETDECNIHDLVSKYQLEQKVWFYGPAYDESKLGELIYNAQVCVSPGNVGLTAMHCMVYGLPVVTHNNFLNQMPEFESIEPGVTGDYFIENSVEDLYTKIEYWISINKNERDHVRESCYQKIREKYNPHFQLEVIKNVLNE
ncbi:MAG TPA: glycosyltransferase [Hanamia sp.]